MAAPVTDDKSSPTYAGAGGEAGVGAARVGDVLSSGGTVPGGPIPQCPIVDEPMPNPANGTWTDAAEALEASLAPGESIERLFDVRFGLTPPKSCLARLTSCICTRPRDPSGVVALTTNGRLLAWQTVSSRACTEVLSYSEVRSYNITDLSHAQVIRVVERFGCFDKLKACCCEPTRAAHLTSLSLSFGGVNTSSLSTARARMATGLPHAVSPLPSIDLSRAGSVFQQSAQQRKNTTTLVMTIFSLIYSIFAGVLDVAFKTVKTFAKSVVSASQTVSFHALPVGGATANSITIVSNEWDLLQSAGRNYGKSPWGGNDNGFSHLVEMKRRILAYKAMAMNRKVTGGDASLEDAPMSLPGSAGPGWSVPTADRSMPLLSIDPGAAHDAEASTSESPTIAVALTEKKSENPLQAVSSVPTGGSHPSGGGRRAVAEYLLAQTGSLHVSVDPRLVPLLPKERVVSTLPGRRSISVLDIIALVCIVLCVLLAVVSAIAGAAAPGETGNTSADSGSSTGGGGTSGGSSGGRVFPTSDDTPIIPGLPNDSQQQASDPAAVVLGAGVLLTALLAETLMAVRAGGLSDQAFVAVPGGLPLAVLPVVAAGVVITAAFAGTTPAPIIAAGCTALVGLLALLSVVFGLLRLTEGMSAVILTSHRLIHVGVRSSGSLTSGDFGAATDEKAMMIDTWWLPAGVISGQIIHSRIVANAQVRVSVAHSHALEISPIIEPRNPFTAALYAMSAPDHSRINSFFTALASVSPPAPVLERARFPPPPPGQVMQPQLWDPYFSKGAFDDRGVGSRVKLFKGEVVLAYFNALSRPYGLQHTIQRLLTCGTDPKTPHVRVVLTNMRMMALSWNQNDPQCLREIFNAQEEVFLFGPALESAKNLTVEQFVYKPGGCTIPCLCDPSVALTVVQTIIAGKRMSVVSEVAAGGLMTKWGGLGRDPRLIHMQHVVGAMMRSRMEIGERYASAPSVLVRPDALSAIAFREAFGAPASEYQAKSRTLRMAQQEWERLTGGDGSSSHHPAGPAAAAGAAMASTALMPRADSAVLVADIECGDSANVAL